MRKKTTMGLVIATILTAYISVLTFSNQAFAQILGREEAEKVVASTEANLRTILEVTHGCNVGHPHC
jgi:hypothetical protein